MISTGILFVISIQAILIHFGGNDSKFSLKWYHPISIILAGLLCSIPSLVFERYEQMEKGKFIGKLIVHCIFLYLIIVLMGYLFVWYDSVKGFAYVSAEYFVVYIFVWLSSIWMFKRDDNKINEALKDIRDDE